MSVQEWAFIGFIVMVGCLGIWVLVMLWETHDNTNEKGQTMIKGQLLKLLVRIGDPVKAHGEFWNGEPLYNGSGTLWWATDISSGCKIIVDASNWPAPEVLEGVGRE